MADVDPRLLALATNVKEILALYEKKDQTILDLIEACRWEIVTSRPYNHTGHPRDNAARDQKRKVLIQTLDAVLETAGRPVSGLRGYCNPPTNDRG